MQYPTTFEEIANQYEDIPYGMITLGYIFMGLFIVFSLASFQKPLRSRWVVGIMGLVAVGAAAGGGASLFLLCGGKLNALMLVVLPFFALGMGVNDMFVFLRHFTAVVASGEQTSVDDVVCQTLIHAGPGALVTSCCNFCIFLCGAAMLPVPALADFCASAAIVAALNYIAILTQVVPLLVLAARQATDSEDFGGSRLEYIGAACRAQIPSPMKNLEKRIARMPRKSYNIISCLLVALAMACLAGSVILIRDKTIGYDPAELVKDDTPQRRPVQVFFEEFNSFPAFLCFHNVDVPHKQREMLELFTAVTSQKHSQPFLMNYLSAFYLHQMMTQQTSTLDPTWSDNMLAPLGTVASNQSFYQLFHAWSRVPLENPALAWSPAGMGFLSADIAFANEFSYVTSNKTTSPALQFSFFPFYIVDLHDDNDFVKSIEETNKLLEQSPLKGKVSVYGATFTFWSVFIDLEKSGWSMTVICLTTVFCCTFFCSLASSSALASTWGRAQVKEICNCVILATISTLACAMIVAEIYGFSMTFLKYNQFVAMALIAAAGISIEFVAHLVAAFLGESGTTQERVTRAWGIVSPAVIQGSLSTLVGIAPMALSPFVFVVKYCFGMLALVQIVGLVNGFLFLPSFLSIAGSLCGSDSKAKSASEISAPTSASLPSVLGSEGAMEQKKTSAQV
jgi:hypothetical protein